MSNNTIPDNEIEGAEVKCPGGETTGEWRQAEGTEIKCPCGESTTVYNMDWESLMCPYCKQYVSKLHWSPVEDLVRMEITVANERDRKKLLRLILEAEMENDFSAPVNCRVISGGLPVNTQIG